MSAKEKLHLVSEEEFLDGELNSEIKHEYLAGAVYAMSGARNRHNDISGNVFASLHSRLRGSPCKPCNSDTKVRIRLSTGTRFYYPDAMVVCRPNSDEDAFQDEPVVIVEVLSDSTRRLDLGEKKEAYLTIPSLNSFLAVEQDAPEIAVYRRSEGGFDRNLISGVADTIELPNLGIGLPLAEIYEGIAFE